jgi:hypothetical protein
VEKVAARARATQQALRGIFISTFYISYRVYSTGFFVLSERYEKGTFDTEKLIIEVEKRAELYNKNINNL